MNEPTNFRDKHGSLCTNNTFNFPPYPAIVFGSDNDNGIFEKTICMDTVQGNGQRHYDVHYLYGISMAKATFELSIINK